jgi:hypothetical protein
MSDVTGKENEKATEAQPAAESAPAAKKLQVTKLIGVLKQHPLGLVAVIGAAVALVEVELAVGLLTGIGATALLATKNGAEARHEVVAKGKAALERARAVLASRGKPADAPAATADVPAPATAPAPAAAAPGEQPPTPAV